MSNESVKANVMKFEERSIRFRAKGLVIEKIDANTESLLPAIEVYVSMPEFSEIDSCYNPEDIVKEFKYLFKSFSILGGQVPIDNLVKAYLKIRKGEVWTREKEEQTTLDSLVGISTLKYLDKIGYEF